MTNSNGSTSKDSMYLKRMLAAIKGKHDHPRNNGVKMQAHHLISIEGMKRSGLSSKIKKFQYNINYLPNLVFIPCTLQGACYLGVQPHRGNHGDFVNQDVYDDNIEQFSYHEMVAISVKKLDLPLSKECPGDKVSKIDHVKNELDKLSKYILKLIEKQPKMAMLTSIAVHFGKGGVGCACVDAVDKHSVKRSCSVERRHLFDPSSPAKSQAQGQAREEIMYVKPAKYRLKVGSDE
jgi:hypothetical protein